MNRISTHVLDTALGQPASGVPVTLVRLETSGEWSRLASAKTDQDGRCLQLLPEAETLNAGTYRLAFDTGSYYAARKNTGLYPLVQITFEVRAGESHFHIPLLLSPNSYTTYRGS
jgi:5-hydroxyisourate hydrolase